MRRFILFIGLCCLLAFGGLAYAFSVIKTPILFQGSRRIVVAPRDTPQMIAATLRKEGLVQDSQIFVWYLSASGLVEKIKAGEYYFQSPVSAFQIARDLSRGVPHESVLRLREGSTVREVAAAFSLMTGASQNEFITALRQDYRTNHPLIPQEAQQQMYEGYLFPDTYRFFADSSPHDMIEKILDTFDQKFDESIRNAAHAQGHTIHEVVTLASILEREVPDDKDRRIVADIFLRRLDQRMPLQADSTVNYITGKHDPQVRGVDLAVDSLYNTYRYRGLPPGPICNPSLSALQAVVHPTPNEYLYFLTTPDGRVVYGKTYDDHLKNKRLHLSQSK